MRGKPSEQVMGVPRSINILVTGWDQKDPFKGFPSGVSLITGSSSKHPSLVVSMATKSDGHLMTCIELPAGIAVNPSEKYGLREGKCVVVNIAWKFRMAFSSVLHWLVYNLSATSSILWWEWRYWAVTWLLKSRR